MIYCQHRKRLSNGLKHWLLTTEMDKNNLINMVRSKCEKMINILVLISVGLFLFLMIGRTIMLTKRGIKVWVISGSSKNMAKRILEILFIPGFLTFFILVAATAANIFSLPFLWQASKSDIAGITLCYIGLAIFFCALVSFGESWRIGVDEKNSDKLIQKGVFAISRNPIFLFMDMYFLGMALVYPTILFIVICVAFFIGIHMQILSEEAFLKKKFGEEYALYCKKVRRYL